MPEQAIGKNLRVLRTSFLEQADIKDLDALKGLTPKDLADMNRECPVAMSQCIIELLSERESLKARNESQTKTIIDLHERMKKDKA